MTCSFVAAGRARRILFNLLIVGAVPVAARPVLAQNPTPVSLPPIVSTAEGATAEIRGLIVARRGDEMYVRASNGLNIVVLTDSTNVVAPSGFMKTSKKHYDVSVLIPGLGVTVDGTGMTDGRLFAHRVKFAKEALKVAQQIEAGGEVVRADVDTLKNRVDTLNARVSQNERAAQDSINAINSRAAKIIERISSLDEYSTKASATVNFKTASAQLSDSAKAALDQLVANATGLNGYMIQVFGYADSRGTDRMNQRLSDARADAVVDYLVRQKNVPPRRILNPTGFGESRAIGSNRTATGRAMNRRAEVQVLVNTGISGGPGANQP